MLNTIDPHSLYIELFFFYFCSNQITYKKKIDCGIYWQRIFYYLIEKCGHREKIILIAINCFKLKKFVFKSRTFFFSKDMYQVFRVYLLEVIYSFKKKSFWNNEDSFVSTRNLYLQTFYCLLHSTYIYLFLTPTQKNSRWRHLYTENYDY